MTPEERAAKLVEDIAALADFTCDGRVSEQAAEDAKQEIRNDIAAAIRAAENDALERTIDTPLMTAIAEITGYRTR